jgi:hypothetical protein
MAFLGLVVVYSDLRSELDLFDLDLELVLSRLLRALFLLVAVLRVVHDAGHGWIRTRRDLDQVEPLLEREVECLARLQDSDLPALLVHEAHAWRSDLLVDAFGPGSWNDPLAERGSTSPWSQVDFTKLSVPSFERQDIRQAKCRCTQRHGSSNLLG